jgi:phage shock protein A
LREKIQDLESEKQKLDNNYQTSQQEVNQKDNEISEFKRKIEQLESRPNITLEE